MQPITHATTNSIKVYGFAGWFNVAQLLYISVQWTHKLYYMVFVGMLPRRKFHLTNLQSSCGCIWCITFNKIDISNTCSEIDKIQYRFLTLNSRMNWNINTDFRCKILIIPIFYRLYFLTVYAFFFKAQGFDDSTKAIR